MHIRKGEYEKAADALEDAEDILATEPQVPKRWRPQILFLKARVSELRGETDRAIQELEQSIQLEENLFDGSRLTAFAQLAKGRLYTEQARYEEASDAFTSGFERLEARGGDIDVDEFLPFLEFLTARGGLRSDDDAVDDIALAVKWSQLIRDPRVSQTVAATTARLIAEQQSATGGGADIGAVLRALETARLRGDNLKEQLSAVQADPSTLSAPLAAVLQTRVDEAEAEARRLERGLRSDFPEYQQLINRPVEFADIVNALQPNEALFQVLVGGDRSYGLLVTREASHRRLFPIDLSLDDFDDGGLADKLRDNLDNVTERTFPLREAAILYEKLLGPVRDVMKSEGGIDHLITVPNGPLLSLPFGVLVASSEGTDPTQEDFSDVAWLAKDMAISLAPSVRTFVYLRNDVQASDAPNAFIGFGDLAEPENDAALGEQPDLPAACAEELQRQIDDLGSLPDSDEELRAIQKIFDDGPTRLVRADEFSDTEVTSERLDLASYRVLYFSTHGFLPNDFDCVPEPSLLTSVSAGDAASDGFLTAGEILNLRLDADLVVLSACNTGGAGHETGGESLSGLARSFFYAGARALLVSHWRVPSAPTTRLMIDMFSNLRLQANRTAFALREGQRAMMQDPGLSHPRNWAGFSLVGDGGAHDGA